MSSDSGEGVLAVAGFLFLSGPMAGAAAYGAIKAKYRNMGAKYRPDKAVAHTVSNITSNDVFVETTMSDSSVTPGRNENAHDERLATSRVTKD